MHVRGFVPVLWPKSVEMIDDQNNGSGVLLRAAQTMAEEERVVAEVGN